jgi:hypothetical protein
MSFHAKAEVKARYPRLPVVKQSGDDLTPAEGSADVRFGVIVDVEASRAVRQAEVGVARTMLERTEQCFGLKPQRLAAASAYGSAPMLNWLVEDKQITPHISVIDKSKREHGTFSRSDFRYDAERDAYHCPAGKELRTGGTVHQGTTRLYRASKLDCDRCSAQVTVLPVLTFLSASNPSPSSTTSTVRRLEATRTR